MLYLMRADEQTCKRRTNVNVMLCITTHSCTCCKETYLKEFPAQLLLLLKGVHVGSSVNQDLSRSLQPAEIRPSFFHLHLKPTATRGSLTAFQIHVTDQAAKQNVSRHDSLLFAAKFIAVWSKEGKLTALIMMQHPTGCQSMSGPDTLYRTHQVADSTLSMFAFQGEYSFSSSVMRAYNFAISSSCSSVSNSMATFMASAWSSFAVHFSLSCLI